jgi:predicted metal-dependent peptidase
LIDANAQSDYFLSATSERFKFDKPTCSVMSCGLPTPKTLSISLKGAYVPHESEDLFETLEAAAAHQSMEEAAKQLLAGARASLIIGRDAKSAFFATLMLRQKHRPSWQIVTLATDGKELHYNPEFVTGLSFDELVGVLVHEVMHCALAHPFRRGHRDAKLWNIVCDLAINPILRDAGFTLPPCRLMPSEGSFAHLAPGKTAEEYYVDLLKAREEDHKGDGSPENDADDPGGCGEVIDAAADDPAASQAMAPEWRVALVQAEVAAKGRGELPAGLGRIVESTVNPPLDWKSVLREFVASSAKNDYSWIRPNRRFIAQGLYLPGLYSEELGEVVIAVDTSGSIHEAALAQFGEEVKGVLAAYDCSVSVLYHDSEVQNVQSWRSTDGPLVLDPVGGGGTSHVCVFDWIDQSGTTPACVICFTDLETEFPATAPAIPVLWAVVGGMIGTPPFGRIIHIGS